MKKTLLTICVIISGLAQSQEMFTFKKEADSYWAENSSYEFKNANAFEIELEEISVIDIERSYGPVWNVIFTPNSNKIVFTRGKNGNNEIVVMNIETLNDIVRFKGSRLHAVSSDANRIFYDNSIYDIKQKKNYPINADIWNLSNTTWQDGNKAWLEDDYIISYKNLTSNGKSRPYSEKYLKLDLNDLQIKRMNTNEINNAFNKLQKLKHNHKNFYLHFYSTTNIIVQDKKTPFSKSILYSKNGYPIKTFWTSPNLEYLAVRKYSQRYTNKYELVLYKLKYKPNNKQLFFKATNPNRWLDKKFKSVFNQANGVGVWADVYEAKINPLNNKVIGPDKNKRKGSIKIVKDLGNNKIGLMVGRYQKDLKDGDVITNFRKSDRDKDNNGAWSTIEKWDYLDNCNIDFTKLKIGMDDRNVIALHSSLNMNKKTQVADKGINSPGNEGSLFYDATTDAIKRFQRQKGINATGIIDSKTSRELNKICSISSKRDSLNKLK